jgi:hypothetical protein
MRPFASLLIASWLTAGSPPVLHADESEQLAAFARAYELYSQGQNAGAKELFQQTLSEKFVLTDYGLYYLAKIAFTEKA